MELIEALAISGRRMDAHGTRLRVIAENLANPHRTGFEDAADGSLDADGRALTLKDGPSRLANAQGCVEQSNVDGQAEVMEMHEAQRTYHANLSVMQASRSMLTRAIEMLK